MTPSKAKHVLVVDDNENIHQDFRKILESTSRDVNFENLKASILNTSPKVNIDPLYIDYQIDSAFQGQEAVLMVKQSIKNNDPYELAFVDVRMPPGWNGIETIKQIWEVDPNIEIVICTAFSDYSWESLYQELKFKENFLILKKPFDMIEVRQLAASLTKKWELKNQVQYHIDNLEQLVKKRGKDLEKTLSLSHATLESAREGILVIDNHQQIVLYNQLFLKLFELEANTLKSNDLNSLLTLLSSKLKEPSDFISTMKSALTHQKIGIMGEWMFDNGKTIELFCNRQYLNNDVIGVVFCFQNITERIHFEEKLRYLSLHDQLTDLPNRTLNADRLDQAIALAKRSNTMIGILSINLDHFRYIADTLGDKIADKLIKDVAIKLKNNIRDIDTLSHLGNDDFMIILSNYSSEQQIITKINFIFNLFSESTFLDQEIKTLTASIGVSIYPKDSKDPKTLIKYASIALQRAKEMGGNNTRFYEAEFNEKLQAEIRLSSDLHQAINKNQFVLHYQPLIDIRTLRITGVEALIRWQHPTLGLISPKLFIPIAEQLGLIHNIGLWVLIAACKQMKTWHNTIDPELTMAVNISGHQIRQQNFAEFVTNVITETNINPHKLVLEITESVVLSDIPDITTKMNNLKNKGVKFSLDDFGTGYASISFLKLLPFDTVKIDRSFIEKIPYNRYDQSIIKAIIAMSKALEKEIIAEGIENIEQIEYLKSIGINQIQGFYFSKPIDEEQCTKLLNKKFLEI